MAQELVQGHKIKGMRGVAEIDRLRSRIPEACTITGLRACHRFYSRSQNCEKRLLASSCLCVLMEQLGSHWTDFHEI
jgi:hypothetical protein